MRSKKLALFFVIVFILSLIGCAQSKSIDISELIIEKAKSYEMNEDQFIRLQISYDEFKENMKDIVVDINYFDNREMFGYKGISGNRMYLAKDLVGLTLDEIKILEDDVENEQRKQYEEKGLDYDKYKKEMEIKYGNPFIEIKLSNVYDYKGYNWKYVYSQTHIKYNNNNKTEGIINKRYRFVEENGGWKILNVDQSFANWGKDSLVMKEELLKNLKYTTFNNEAIEYIKIFQLRETN